MSLSHGTFLVDRRWRFCLAAFILLGAARPCAAQAPGRTAPPGAVSLRIWVDQNMQEVTLTGRGPDHVQLGPSAVQGALTGRIPIERIERAQFRLDFSGYELAQAIHQRDWEGAVRVLSPSITPALPYLDLPDNNAADLALELGTYMMRAAHRRQRGDDPESARRGFEAAYSVFRSCSSVDWSPVGALAMLKGCRALLAMGRANTAREQLLRITSPMPGDAAFGHYWLVTAELAEEAGDWQASMDAAVRSIAFENKDIETFPEALMLSARAYAALLEWHRARDVYYEIASIFPNTDYADDAAGALREILDGGFTEEAEEVAAERAFFGLVEDMNARARELLERRDAGQVPTLRRPETEGDRDRDNERGLPDLEAELQAQ